MMRGISSSANEARLRFSRASHPSAYNRAVRLREFAPTTLVTLRFAGRKGSSRDSSWVKSITAGRERVVTKIQRNGWKDAWETRGMVWVASRTLSEDEN